MNILCVSGDHTPPYQMYQCFRMPALSGLSKICRWMTCCTMRQVTQQRALPKRKVGSPQKLMRDSSCMHERPRCVTATSSATLCNFSGWHKYNIDLTQLNTNILALAVTCTRQSSPVLHNAIHSCSPPLDALVPTLLRAAFIAPIATSRCCLVLVHQLQARGRQFVGKPRPRWTRDETQCAFCMADILFYE